MLNKGAILRRFKNLKKEALESSWNEIRTALNRSCRSKEEYAEKKHATSTATTINDTIHDENEENNDSS